MGPFLSTFSQNWIFLEKRALSVFQYSNCLPLSQNSEKSNESLLRKLLDGYTKNQFIPLVSSWDTANFKSCDWLKNLAIWLARSILGHISETIIFLNMKFVQAYSNYSNINFHYRSNWEKIKELRKKTKLSYTFKEP